jgi:hypothetical protein
VTTFAATSYENPARAVTATSEAVIPPSTTPGPVTGCSSVAFNPGVKVTPETTQADAPSGYRVDLTIPQNDDPDGRATSQLRGARVTLPPGAGISPGAADGLQVCTDAQLGVGSNNDPTCPDASKVGTVSFDVPLLQKPVVGDIFLGSPTPANPFRVFLVGRGSGLTVKLRGNVTPDPATGQLSTEFADNPQVPFSKFTLQFKGGPRAILANPRTCGTALTSSTLTPWSGRSPLSPTSAFTVTGCGNSAFNPEFQAGGASTQAGADTSFTLTAIRGDTQPELQTIDVSMPPGLVGRLASVPMCPAAAAATGACDPSTRVGSATIASGSGSAPLTLGGTVYLAEPTSPQFVASLAIVTRAVAGPFDLGTVVVPANIRLRPEDSGLDIVSAPLPTTLGGIPLRLRQVTVTVDRPGFMTNPTSCAPQQVKGTIGAASGEKVLRTAPVTVTGCENLPFRPEFSIRIGGRRGTGKNRNPQVVTTITQPPGDANMKSVAVMLPSQIALQIARLKGLCDPAQHATDTCPEFTRVGAGEAQTPVLAGGLRGPAFLVSTTDGLAKIVVRLRGQISLDLVGNVQPDRKGRLVTVFPAIPDVPISAFALTLQHGSGSPLGNVTNLCKARKPAARVMFLSQTGRRIDRRVRAKVDGCRKAKKHKASSKAKSKSKSGGKKSKRARRRA